MVKSIRKYNCSQDIDITKPLKIFMELRFHTKTCEENKQNNSQMQINKF